MRTVLFLAAIALLTAAASADVDVQIGNGDKVSGTIEGGVVETFRVELPQDTVLSVSVKGKKTKGAAAPSMRLQVLDAGDTDVSADLVSVKGTGAKVKLTAPTTGEYRIVVTSADQTAGTYQLKAKWKSPTKYGLSAEFRGGPQVLFADFVAESGSRVTLDVKADKGSLARPFFVRIDGLGTQQPLPAPDPAATRHKLKKVVLEDSGPLQAVIGNNGDAGGVTAKLVVKAPKPAKRKIDITDANVQPGDGDQIVRGSVVGVPGGLVEADDIALDGDIFGSSVDVPAGALGKPTAILIGTSPDLPPQSSGDSGAGPTVFFGPEGIEFEEAVTVTIPFDPDTFVGDPLVDLQIFTRDAKGQVTLVPGPYQIDVPNGLVRFPVEHFSSFRAFGSVPAPSDLNGDGVDDLVVNAPARNNATGAVFVFFGPITSNTTTAVADVTITGVTTGELFGLGFVVGDVTGDGQPDLLVSSEANVEGSIHVFAGGATFGSGDSTDAAAVVVGALGDGPIGDSLAVGDLNDDDVLDLITGSERANGSGTAFVLFGPASRFPATTATADLEFVGEQTGDLFSAGLATGDVDDDGVDDLVVGADMIDDPLRNGKVYVFFGGAGISGQSGAAANVIIEGQNDGDGFGLEVEVGDVTGNGVADIVASQGSDTQTDNPGQVYVFQGGALTSGLADAVSLTRIAGAGATDRLGSAIALVPLGVGEPLSIVAGAPDHNGGRGAIYIFGGSVALPAPGPVAFGTSAALGDAAGQGFGKLLGPSIGGGSPGTIVAYAPLFGALQNGRVYLFQSPPAGGDASALADVLIDGLPGETLGIDPND